MTARPWGEVMDEMDHEAKSTPLKHTYPEEYPPGSHWAITVGWQIVDSITPGVLSDQARALVCGQIAGALMKVKEEHQRTKLASPEEWKRHIINAGGDENVAQQAVALAALNGLFE